MACEKMSLPQYFLEDVESERGENYLEGGLSSEMVKPEFLRSRFPNLNVLGIKMSEMGIILVASGVASSDETYISLSKTGDVFWWHEGKVSKSLLKKIMALPDYYHQVLEPDVSLEEIHQFQELVEKR